MENRNPRIGKRRRTGNDVARRQRYTDLIVMLVCRDIIKASLEIDFAVIDADGAANTLISITILRLK